MFCKKFYDWPESPIKCIAIPINQVDFSDKMWYYLSNENAIHYKERNTNHDYAFSRMGQR